MADLMEAMFRAPPKEFVAARDLLVAELKAAGQASEARAAKALKRPSVPVWLWNRLVLDGEKSAREALAAVTVLALAIERSDTAKLHEATAELRAATGALTQRAHKLAVDVDVGFSPAHERELAELVQALPWNATARDEASRGHLREVPPPVDPLEAMRLLAGAPPPARRVHAHAKSVEAPVESHEPVENDQSLLEAESALAGAESLLADATAAHTTAKRDLERTESEVARTQKIFDEAKEKLGEAKGRVEEAKGREEEIGRQKDEAQQAAEEARVRLDRIKRR